MFEGALNGIRLIELGQLASGPFCGQLMADHGAEVIKIEPPAPPGAIAAGDPMRRQGEGRRLHFPVIARNKRAITLNLTDPRGQEICRKLVARSDLLLENFRPGTLERWGLGWEELSAANPGLIMIRVSPFGQTGPAASRAGNSAIAEAMGGLRHLAGDPHGPPTAIGLSLGDSLAGTFACLGALMALHHRNRTGQGQVVDVAQYEAVLAMLESTVPDQAAGGMPATRAPAGAPTGAYPCADGAVLIDATRARTFGRLAEAIGQPALADDPRFATEDGRREHRDALDQLIAGWTSGRSVADVLVRLEEFAVPAGRIHRVPDMMTDPHFAVRESLVRVPHPELQGLVMQNIVPKLSQTPGRVRWPGPPLGADNRQVYREWLGLTDDDLAGLASEGII